MNKKLIVLDTETTGLEVDQGHRVIDIGAIVLKDRKKTNEYFQSYLNPAQTYFASQNLRKVISDLFYPVNNSPLSGNPFPSA